MLPGPIVLLSTYCPLSFPGAQKSSWEEKDPTSVFLAYNWLIIFGGAAAGSPLPPRRGLQQRFSAVWTLLSLCLCDSNPTLRVRGEDFGFFFGTREEIWVTPPSRTGVNSNQVARLNPCIFICRGGGGLIKWYPIMYYADQADWLHHFVTISNYHRPGVGKLWLVYAHMQPVKLFSRARWTWKIMLIVSK